MRQVWWNGKYLPESEAKVSIYDSCCMFADMPFEMQRTFNRKTFKLQEHLDRLWNSCKVLEIDIPYTKEEVYQAHEELLQWHIDNFPEEEEWRSLCNVTRGILPMYQPLIGGGGTNVIIACFPLRYVLRGHSHLYAKGVHAIVSQQRAIPQHLLDVRCKTRSRLHYRMADLQVKKIDEEALPILIDPEGNIAESSGSNIFIIKNGKVYSPFVRNTLDGISRRFDIYLCGSYFIEKDLTPHDCYEADEMFFTNTPYCILPITKFNGQSVGDGKMGKKTIGLIGKWIVEVGCDFVQQAVRWDE